MPCSYMYIIFIILFNNILEKTTTMREKNNPKWPKSLNLNGKKLIISVNPVILTYRQNQGNAEKIFVPQSEHSIPCQALQLNTNQKIVQINSLPYTSHLVHDHDYCAQPNHLSGISEILKYNNFFFS